MPASTFDKKQILLLLAFIFSSCAGAYISYSVDHYSDEFDGYTIDRMNGNYVVSDVLNVSNSLWLNAQRFISKDKKVSYSLIVDYWDSEWLNINEGETLVLLVDDERIGLSGPGSSNNSEVSDGINGDVYKERAFYDITPEQLLKIAKAKQVKLKVTGSGKNVLRTLNAENIDNIKRFVNMYCNVQ